MCVKRCPPPLLRRGLRICRIQDPRDLGQGLIIIDDAAGPAKIVADQAGDELDESLPVPQNAGLECAAEDGVRDDQREDGRNPAGQQNRDDDVESFEPITAALLQEISQRHIAGRHHSIAERLPSSWLGSDYRLFRMDLLGSLARMRRVNVARLTRTNTTWTSR